MLIIYCNIKYQLSIHHRLNIILHFKKIISIKQNDVYKGRILKIKRKVVMNRNVQLIFL